MNKFNLARPRYRATLIGSGIAIIAILVGAIIGYTDPFVTLAILGSVAIGILILSNLEIGLWGVILVVAVLPFATLPLKLILTPSMLDIVLGCVLVAYLGQWMAGYRRSMTITPAHGPILAFVAVSILAFVFGLQHSQLTPNLARQFSEFLLSISVALIVIDHVQDRQYLERSVRVILICGTIAALIGLILYLIPIDRSEGVLNSLSRIGYPSGSVLRYIEDNPANTQRAIGTSVDPNVFGGLLAMIGALATPQLAAAQPVLGRRWLTWAAFAIILVTLVLTFSRAAMSSLAIAMLWVSVMRYRRLVWVFVLAVAIVFMLPNLSEVYGMHFVEGLYGRDLATQMRFGEYKDAFILLGRYPLLGVGFATAPDIDIYLGVSNAYLTIAEEMGFVGLLVFLIAIGVVWRWAYVHRRAALRDSSLADTWLGIHAGLVAVLVVGLFDHYFVNLDFHPAQTVFWIFVGLALAATRLAMLCSPIRD